MKGYYVVGWRVVMRQVYGLDRDCTVDIPGLPNVLLA